MVLRGITILLGTTLLLDVSAVALVLEYVVLGKNEKLRLFIVGLPAVNVAMDTLESIGIGIALSAACGFRIFVPPLVMSIAALFGHLPLTTGFEWIGTYPALMAFAIATSIEVAAYYIPWLDNFLDIFATPAALSIGTLSAAALFPNTDPLLQWTMAAIAGGGSAGIIQGLMGITRLSSTTLTIGAGNAVIATIEFFGALILSVLALLVPFLAIALVAVLLLVSLSKGRQILARTRQS